MANQGDIGGAEVMLLEMAAALRDAGRPVTVVGPAGSMVLAAADAAGVDTVAVPGHDRKRYLAHLRRWDRTRDGLLWCNGLAPALATAGHPARVVHLHQLPRGAQRHAARIACAGARVIVPSEFMRGQAPGATVLPNWCAPVEPAPRPDAVARPGAGGGAVPVVGFLGRISSEKGVVVLAEALERVQARRPVRVLVAGESRFVDPTDAARVEAALARVSNVETPGWMTRADFFGRVDLAVFPSLVRESFGLVAAEAMSARVPFVVSDAGALPEVAGPEHPWVVPAGDPAALADTICAALDTDTAARRATVERARERWERSYAPQAGRAELLRVHASLLGRLAARDARGGARS